MHCLCPRADERAVRRYLVSAAARCHYPRNHDGPFAPVSLPEHEFIELRNLSPRTVNLAGWKVRGNGGSATLPAYSLEPGGYVVVAPRKGAPLFQPSVDAGSFFALHNDEDLLSWNPPRAR